MLHCVESMEHHWEIPGTPGGTVGQTGPWESPMVVGIHGTSLGNPRDSWWDCWTDRTLGEPNGGGNPWNIPGTLGGTKGLLIW